MRDSGSTQPQDWHRPPGRSLIALSTLHPTASDRLISAGSFRGATILGTCPEPNRVVNAQLKDAECLIYRRKCSIRP
jgi:hypothetical protein